MAFVRGDDIQIEHENKDHNDDHNNNDGNDQATGGAAGGPGMTNFNLWVEQNKILEFFRSKSKDISAADFIQRLEDLAKTNRWSDAQTTQANSLWNLD